MKKRGHSRSRNRQFRKKPEIKMDEWILDNPRIKNVQVIAENGDNLGTMPAKEAYDIAQESNLNLLCISLKGDTPICRILDYGKFRFNKQKKERQSRKKQTKIVVKEYRVSISTSDHDISYRVDRIREALIKGQHVKISIKLFGRFLGIEGAGFDVIKKMLGMLGDEIVAIDKEPVRNNRYVDVYLAPSKSVLQKIKIDSQAQRKEKEIEEKKNQNSYKIKNSEETNLKDKETKGDNDDGSKTENKKSSSEKIPQNS